MKYNEQEAKYNEKETTHKEQTRHTATSYENNLPETEKTLDNTAKKT